MSSLSFAELNEPFCSYCGRPPPEPLRARPPRVCARCELGMVLRASAEAAPRRKDPFVIVDHRLMVQALSRRAEIALGVDEPAGVNLPLKELLIPETADPDGTALARGVTLALAGTPLPAKVTLRRTGDPQTRFAARIATCGPPAAALLVLAPLA